MNLYLVENDATIESIITHPCYVAGRDVVLCFNYLPYTKLSSMAGAHRFHLIEELLTRDDYRELHSAIDRIARNWYRSNRGDDTLHDGISYGAITEIVLSRDFMLNVLLKYGEVLRLAIRRYAHTKRVVHDFSNDSNYFYFWDDDRGRFFNKQRLVECVARQLGLAVEYLESPRLIPPRWTSSIERFSNPATLSWKHRIKSSFKAVGGQALNLLCAFAHPFRGSSVYFFSYFNIKSLLSFTGPGVLIPSPSLAQLKTGARYLDLMRIDAALDSSDRDFVQRLTSEFAASTGVTAQHFSFNGLDYREIFSPAIAYIASERIPFLLRYARQVEAAIKARSIRRMVLIDVMSEMAKTVLAVCRKLGLETIFLDHGIMGHSLAQRSTSGVNPDLILKPDHFDSLSSPYPYNLKAASLTLGNPCTDPYHPTRRKRVSSIKRILLTTHSSNFYGRLDTIIFQEAYFKELLTAIPRLRELGVEIHYRPHAENMEYHKYLFDFFGVDMASVQMSEWDRPFSDLIYEMDLYVGSCSTTFYESLAAGVPAVFFDPHHIPDAYFPPLNGKSGDEVLRIETGTELVDLVHRNLENADELASFMDNFHARHARKYLYELDGKASERIAEVIFASNRASPITAPKDA